MTKSNVLLGIVVLVVISFVGCDSSQTGGGTRKAGTAAARPCLLRLVRALGWKTMRGSGITSKAIGMWRWNTSGKL
jgi:hypothetical protein